MKKVYYLCYFDIPEHESQQRNYVLSAATKSSYICKALEKAGYEVEIVSAAGTCGKTFCKGSVTELSEHITLRLFDAKPVGTLPQRLLARRFLKKQLKEYLLKNVTENDVLLVYHSLGYMDVVTEVRKHKKIPLCLEVEEVYGDVINDKNAREREFRFFKSADKFIFPTELLSEKVNTQSKPEVVIYGTYENTPQFSSLFQDGKIHCVYAGVLEPRKGAQTAVAAAEFLPENYHIHIIGFGSEQDTQAVKDQIDAVSKKTPCTVTYDGKYSGDEYLQFLQSCQVGFATQNADAAFNETSFPSKVLSYLSNGLRVVSVRIKAIEVSAVSDLLYFYDGNDPQAAAEAVKRIDFTNPYFGREKIQELDSRFSDNLKALIGE